MNPEYPLKILTRRPDAFAMNIQFTCILLALLCCLSQSKATLSNTTDTQDHDDELFEPFETINYRDSDDDTEHVEYAFKAPMKGLPMPALNMYCASIKVRLYWGVYREATKSGSYRREIHVRRMARLARHLFDDIRAVDDPFNATRLSVIDQWFGVEKEEEAAKDMEESEDVNDYDSDYNDYDSSKKSKGFGKAFVKSKQEFKVLASKLSWRTSTSKKDNSTESLNKTRVDDEFGEDQFKEVEASDSFKELEMKESSAVVKRVKHFLKKYAPKWKIVVYTRWRTMWWMMMSCLYAKYYLWDPALDEFTKLKRSLVMYPEFQLLRLADLDCLPVKFFKRILDVCKILNPLLNFTFGQFSLDKLTRFKGDPS